MAAATLVAVTCGAIAGAAKLMPAAPKTWVICGGGSHNMAIMRGLREAVATCANS